VAASVQPVPHHELVGQLEQARILERYGDQPAIWAVKQHAHIQAGRLAGAQRAQQVVQRQPRVDHVLDKQDVAATDRVIEILGDAHCARPAASCVLRDGHKVDGNRHGDLPQEIRHKEHHARQHAHQDRVLAGIVVRYLNTKRRNPRLDGALRVHHAQDVIRGGRRRGNH